MNHRGERFEGGSAQSLLSWAIETFGTGLSIGTSFGPGGIVLIDLALRLQPDIDIFYIDTGFFFAETEALVERMQQHYQRSFRRITPSLTVGEQSAKYGPNLCDHDPDLCCHLRKVEPLRTALFNSTAWATALRRDQSPARSNTPAIIWNEHHNVVKLSPLANWLEADVWRHIYTHDLPYNALHDRDYPSIGCWPCTRAVKPGEDARGGRWPGIEKTECGLHLAK